MLFASSLHTLRDQILTDLDSVHDYFTHSQAAWRIVRNTIDQGNAISVRNNVTGSLITEKELPDRIQAYMSGFLAISTFQQYVSLFEDFVFGLLRVWLLSYPFRLERKQVPMSIVLTATHLDDVKLGAVNRELHELGYKKVRDWFAYLEDMAKLGCPTSDEIESLAEIKATRDIFVHNRGVVSTIYEEKAGSKKRGNVGDRLDLTRSYHRRSWSLIRRVVSDMSAAAIAKS